MNIDSQYQKLSVNTTESKYKLSLGRFRGFESFSLDFPASGIILLDGRSGIGKTTILEAISFALYDNARNSCYPRENRNSKKKQESTWVRLETPHGLSIYRQRRPNLLQVNSSEVSLTDDSAQSYLTRIYGPYSGWLAGGYLKQWDFCAFLTMSSSEKLKFLQEMTIPNQFEHLFELTGKKISESTSQVQELNIQVRICQEMYMQLYNACPDNVKSESLWSPQDVENGFLKYKLEFPDTSESILDQLQILNQAINQKETEEMNQLQSQLSQEQIKIARQSEGYRQRASIEARLNQLQQDLINLPISDKSIDEYEKEVQELSEQIVLARKTERRTQLLSAKTEIQRRLAIIPDVASRFTFAELDQIEKVLSGPSLNDIDNEIHEIELANKYHQLQSEYQKYVNLKQQRQSLESQIVQLEAQINNCPQSSVQTEIETINQKIWSLHLQQQRLSCPKCGVNVYLSEGNLKEIPSIPNGYENTDISQLQMKKDQFLQQERLFQQRATLESSLKVLKSQIDKIPSLVEVILPDKPKYADRTSGQLDFQLNQYQHSKKQRQDAPNIDVLEERKCLSQLSEKSRLINDMQHIDGELNNLKDTEVSTEVNILEELKKNKLCQIQNLRSQEIKRSQLEANRQQLQEQLQALPECPPNEASIQEIQTRIVTYRNDYTEFKKKISAQIQLVKISQLYGKHSQMQQQESIVMQRAAAFQKIRATLITAEYVILDTVLGQINITLAEILALLFSEPISVTLRSLKPLKSNDRIKPEINIEICYKGAEFSNLNELSGGEKSRVSLALLISFARICQAPFMLLDESLSSLDVATKEYAITAIKRYLDNKLVIAVNHDTTEGVYDSVIRLS